MTFLCKLIGAGSKIFKQFFVNGIVLPENSFNYFRLTILKLASNDVRWNWIFSEFPASVTIDGIRRTSMI